MGFLMKFQRMSDDYTPTTEVIRHALAFPRERLGEPRPIKAEAFDRWLEQVKQEARDEALADAGLLARPLPTREEISEVILAESLFGSRTPIAAADAVLALLKGQNT